MSRLIFGSHNSASSYPIVNTLGKFTAWTSRCQYASISEQYAFGCRAFDFNIAIDDANNARVINGLAEFDVNLEQILDYLNRYSETCYVRLRINDTDKDFVERFTIYIESCVAIYKNLKILATCGNEANPLIVWNTFRETTYLNLYKELNGFEKLLGPKFFLYVQHHSEYELGLCYPNLQDNIILYRDFV